MALHSCMADTSPWYYILPWWTLRHGTASLADRLHHSTASLYDGHFTKTLHPCMTDPSPCQCILICQRLHHGIASLRDEPFTMVLHPYMMDPSPMTLFPLSFTTLSAISAVLYYYLYITSNIMIHSLK